MINDGYCLVPYCTFQLVPTMVTKNCGQEKFEGIFNISLKAVTFAGDAEMG